MDSVVRGVAVYVVLLIATRLSGRRTMAQMTPFDFVLLLIIAETTQQALLGDDFSITNAAILIVTLFATDVLLAWVKARSDRAASSLDGNPTVLISRGRIDQEAMRRARVGVGDLLEAARAQHGLKTLDDIAIEETAIPHGREYRFRLRARSFLHNQVRSIVGTLERVGAGSWSPDRVAAALAARDRAECGPVCPPHGLYLCGVGYLQDPFGG